MKITFLGTGTSQGVPMIACPCNVCHSKDSKDKRLRTSILISINDTNIVVDSGPDFRYQMLREDVKTLDALLFTHAHKDHTAGLDDIRAFNYFQKKAIDVYASHKVQDVIRKEFSYIFEERKYPGIPKINFHDIDSEKFSVNDIIVEPIPVMHLKMPVLGFRIKDFTYITDANFISEESKNKIRGSEIIVLNALRREEHISHFNLKEAIQLIKELKPREAYFTHISHQLGLHDQVSKELPKGIHLAYDKLQLQV